MNRIHPLIIRKVGPSKVNVQVFRVTAPELNGHTSPWLPFSEIAHLAQKAGI